VLPVVTFGYHARVSLYPDTVENWDKTKEHFQKILTIAKEALSLPAANGHKNGIAGKFSFKQQHSDEKPALYFLTDTSGVVDIFSIENIASRLSTWLSNFCNYNNYQLEENPGDGPEGANQIHDCQKLQEIVDALWKEVSKPSQK